MPHLALTSVTSEAVGGHSLRFELIQREHSSVVRNANFLTYLQKSDLIDLRGRSRPVTTLHSTEMLTFKKTLQNQLFIQPLSPDVTVSIREPRGLLL